MRVIAVEPDATGATGTTIRPVHILLIADNDSAGGFAACVESTHPSMPDAVQAHARPRHGLLRLPLASPRASPRALRPGPTAPATAAPVAPLAAVAPLAPLAAVGPLAAAMEA